MTTDNRPSRPPFWWESIDAAIADAPEPTAELCDRVAGLVAPHLGHAKRPPQAV